MVGQAPGTTPGGAPATSTAGILPGAIPMPGTTPGGMIRGMDGAGEIPSGMAAGPGTTPGIHLAGMPTPGALIMALTAADGITTATMAIITRTAPLPGVEATTAIKSVAIPPLHPTAVATPTAIITATA